MNVPHTPSKKILAALILCAALLSSPATAQEADPLNPAAPPPSTEPTPDWLKYKSPYTGEQNDVSKPHRTAPEVLAWSQEKVTDIMTLSPADYKGKVGVARALFTDAGWKEYSGYLQATKIPALIETQNYSMNMIVDGDARVLNQGSMQSAYRWLVELPVIISFQQVDDAGMTQQRGGGRFVLTIQLVRTTSKATEDGIAIESWRVRNPSGAK